MAKANEPAFPTTSQLEMPELGSHTLSGGDPRPPKFTKARPGLTKREYFAAMAMQAQLASERWDHASGEVARRSCSYADALIAELEKEHPVGFFWPI